MLNVQNRHLRIIENILSPHDYSFFVFGSRATSLTKPFSDLDLLYFEDIPPHIVMKLEEDFQTSDLPYTVDLVNYHKCDVNFQNLIDGRYLCLQSSSTLNFVEQNHKNHFISHAKTMNITVQEINGLSVMHPSLDTPVSSMVYGGLPDPGDVTMISDIKKLLQDRPFAWWIPPSLQNPESSQALKDAGFTQKNKEYGVIWDLEAWHPNEHTPKLHIQQVTTPCFLKDFQHILERDPLTFCAYDDGFSVLGKDQEEKWFVGHMNDQPTVCSVLCQAVPVASILGIVTLKSNHEARIEMITYLNALARTRGANLVILSTFQASDHNLCQNLGARKIGRFGCFEYPGLTDI